MWGSRGVRVSSCRGHSLAPSPDLVGQARPSGFFRALDDSGHVSWTLCPVSWTSDVQTSPDGLEGLRLIPEWVWVFLSLGTQGLQGAEPAWEAAL